ARGAGVDFHLDHVFADEAAERYERMCAVRSRGADVPAEFVDVGEFIGQLREIELEAGMLPLAIFPAADDFRRAQVEPDVPAPLVELADETDAADAGEWLEDRRPAEDDVRQPLGTVVRAILASSFEF